MNKIFCLFLFILFKTSLFSYGFSKDLRSSQFFSLKTKSIDSFVLSYLKLYRESPVCFLPYDQSKIKKKKHLIKVLVKDFCSGSMKDFCYIEKGEVKESLERLTTAEDFNHYI